MKKLLCISIAFTFALFASEPSAFEAGDINAPNPYGLTKDEKAIWQNRQEIKELKQKLYLLQNKTNTLEQKLVGLRSVVEGVDERLRKIEKNLSNPQNDLQSQVALIQKDLNTTIIVQKENFTQIKKILKELSSMIDKINNSYVSKSEFRSELRRLYAMVEKKRLSSKSGAQLFKEARAAYWAHRYDKAKELFEATLTKRYKPASSHFYLGESCYYTKQYQCAIEHYKKSASLYAKASYMPTLLLHTAISLERLGDKKNAKKFYENLLQLYPHSKSATIAKKHLEKLK